MQARYVLLVRIEEAYVLGDSRMLTKGNLYQHVAPCSDRLVFKVAWQSSHPFTNRRLSVVHEVGMPVL
jgi:hypothetical protein